MRVKNAHIAAIDCERRLAETIDADLQEAVKKIDADADDESVLDRLFTAQKRAELLALELNNIVQSVKLHSDKISYSPAYLGDERGRI